MRSRLLPVLAAGALSLSLLGPAPTAGALDRAEAVPAPASTAPPPESPAEQAAEVLEQAQALGEDSTRGGPVGPAEANDATALLTQLAQVRPDLAPSEQAEADRLFRRPTASGGDGYLNYGTARRAFECGDEVCVHYVTDADDPNAPDLTDADDDGVVDSVARVLATAESVHGTYVDAGYRAPQADTTGPGTGLVDIYLGQLGNQKVYGYCFIDDTRLSGPRNRAAYCAVDNDFDEFLGNPVDNLRVTLAHEYFHAVQFAYDFFEDLWFMEATATWAEDEVFDSINDNRQYLQQGQLGTPGIPLDAEADNGNYYGNWIFFRYLTERFTARSGPMPVLVRDMWERAAGSTRSLAAVDGALRARGTNLTNVYRQFAVANRRPQTTYDEGAELGYPVARATPRTLGPRRQVGLRTGLSHLTHRTYRFNPERTRALAWRLQLDVNMPGRETLPAARVLSYDKRGNVKTSVVRLDRKGDGRVRVPFSTRRVDRVELVLISTTTKPRYDRYLSRVTARTVRG